MQVKVLDPSHNRVALARSPVAIIRPPRPTHRPVICRQALLFTFALAFASRALASCQSAAAGTVFALGFLGRAVKLFCSRAVGGGFGRFRGCVHEAFPEA